MLKLDLGAGARSPGGFTPMGNAHGSPIYPLTIEDNSADVIRASHVLEHFPNDQVVPILQQWASKLKPGGWLRIAVPDLDKIMDVYKSGADAPIQGWIMGGQTAEDDFHKSIFDEELLAESLRQAGLTHVRRWASELGDDCSALKISLNLEAQKPRKHQATGALKVCAVMSVPRLGFMDNFFAAFEALKPMGINLRRHAGAFWEQCLERSIEIVMAEEAPDLILTLDYDTVFHRADLETLVQIMQERPEVDALAPMQSARFRPEPLLTLDPPLGVKDGAHMPIGVFADDITKAKTAHFGATLLRTSALAKLPKPWLWSQPDGNGCWGPERVDADIYFWKAWEKAGLSLYSANRVPVGHLELMVLWPGEDFEVKSQMLPDYQKNGKPRGVWK